MQKIIAGILLATVFLAGCGTAKDQPSGDLAPKATGTDTTTDRQAERRAATPPTPAPLPPEMPRLLRDGKYRLHAMSFTDQNGDEYHYSLGTGAYFMEVTYDLNDGRYLMKRYGIQNASGVGYRGQIGCPDGGFITKVLLSEITKRVVLEKSSLLEDSCDDTDSMEDEAANFSVEFEHYSMSGSELKQTVSTWIGIDNIFYFYFYRLVN